jgi:hypothetical protein
MRTNTYKIEQTPSNLGLPIQPNGRPWRTIKVSPEIDKSELKAARLLLKKLQAPQAG